MIQLVIAFKRNHYIVKKSYFRRWGTLWKIAPKVQHANGKFFRTESKIEDIPFLPFIVIPQSPREDESPRDYEGHKSDPKQTFKPKGKKAGIDFNRLRTFEMLNYNYTDLH